MMAAFVALCKHLSAQVPDPDLAGCKGTPINGPPLLQLKFTKLKSVQGKSIDSVRYSDVGVCADSQGVRARVREIKPPGNLILDHESLDPVMFDIV